MTATATTHPIVELSWDADDQEYHATGAARAIGIQTGSGDDRVENTGTIDVEASVTVRSAYREVTGETAGILTGDGNDMVINSGSIHTETTISLYPNTASSVGIGIATGDGDDMVHLLDQSLVEGHIYHGEGNDTLLLRGAPQISGDILGGTGEDLLIFDGQGSFDDLVFEFEAAAKIGSGTFTVNNMPVVNQLEAIGGTLAVAHNYDLASDGSFTAQVNNDGSHGQFKVDGEVGLDGELRVIRGPGLFHNGDAYDILVADSVIDDFDSKILPDPTPLLHFETTTHADRVEVEAVVESSTRLTENKVEMAVARYVDQIMPSATGELEDYLAVFQSLSREDFKKAFAGFSPESYEKSTRTSLDASHAISQTLQKRMGMLRSSSTEPKSSADADSQKHLLLAYNGTDIGDLIGAREQAQAQRKWGLWLDVFGQRGDQETTDGYTGYDYRLTGGALGFDYLFADSFIVGLGLGHSRADVDVDQDAGAGDIESLVGSLYGSFFTERLYVDTALAYGQQDYENTRNIVIGPLLGTAASEHEGTLFSANLGAGYYFPVDHWFWGPFGSLLYTQLDEDGFTEKGAGALNLAVESRTTESLLSWLGLRAGRAFRFDGATFLPEVSLAWLHDFDIDDSVTTAAIAGAPGSSFSIPGQSMETDGVNAGAALSLISKNGYRASLKYGGDFRGSYTAHALYGEIRIEF